MGKKILLDQKHLSCQQTLLSTIVVQVQVRPGAGNAKVISLIPRKATSEERIAEIKLYVLITVLWLQYFSKIRYSRTISMLNSIKKRFIWFQYFFKQHFVPNCREFCDHLHPTRFHLSKYVLKKQSVSHGLHFGRGWEISQQSKNTSKLTALFWFLKRMLYQCLVEKGWTISNKLI